MQRDTKVFAGIMAGILIAGGLGHAVLDSGSKQAPAAVGVEQSSAPTPAPKLSPRPTPRRPAPTHTPRPVVTSLSEGSPQPPSVVDNAPAVGCGVEREALKVGTDPQAPSVSLTPHTTTIAALSSYATDTSGDRVAPIETTVWRISATLTYYKLESDSDYHLVIQDAQGRTMIAELADPACAHGSPWLRQISAARRAFNSRLDANDRFQAADVPVTVTGVGFFDFDHGQRGVAPNAVELHPVLAITFG